MANKMNNYTLVYTREHVVLIADSNEGISITNSAERVIEDLNNKHFLYRNARVFYIDTDGRVDELVHECGKFKDFKPGYENFEDWKLDHMSKVNDLPIEGVSEK